MATQYGNTLGTLTSGAPGSYLTTDSSGSISWSSQNEVLNKQGKMVEFMEFALAIMGVDLKYSDFEKMSSTDRIAFARDLKINKILD
jgi:hypothetical protein